MTARDSGDQSPARLHLRAASFQDFIEQYSPRVSTEGILLPTDQERAEGAPVEFEISLSDDFRVLRGVGEVEWFAGPQEGEEKAGLAVRFTRMEASSRRLIDRLIERHRRAGGAVFSLVRWPGSVGGREWAAEPAPEIRLSGETERGSAAGRPSRTPAGEDSVLIPAPALDGDPLPADPSLAEPEDRFEELRASEIDSESTANGEPASPADTLHLPKVGEERHAPPGAESGEDVGMEALRVEELQPAPGYPQSPPPPATPPTPTLREAPLPLAGVGRASGADRRRPWLLLVLLGAVAAAAWLGTGTELVERLWNRPQGEPQARAVAQSPSSAASAATEPRREAVESPDLEGGELAAPAADAVAVPAPTDEGVAPQTPADTSPAGPPAAPRANPPAQAEAEPAARLTRIVEVESSRSGEVTEIRLVADGRFVEGGFNGTRVQGGAPRILIRVLGVGEPFPRDTVTIGTPEVERIRVGLHRTGDRLDLHFVADLTSGRIRLVSAEASGRTLALRFSL